jgi:hypothetical protein
MKPGQSASRIAISSRKKLLARKRRDTRRRGAHGALPAPGSEAGGANGEKVEKLTKSANGGWSLS